MKNLFFLVLLIPFLAIAGSTPPLISGAPPLVFSTLTNTMSIPKSTSIVDGYLSAVDWTSFNSKISGPAANFTTSTSGVSITGGTGAVLGSGTSLSIQTASGSQPGLLSAADWTTFNGKQSPLTFGNITSATTGASFTGGTAAVIGAGVSLTIQTASGSQPGLLSSADWTTFNNKQSALTFGNLTSPTSGVSVTGGTGAVIGSGTAVSIQTASGSQNGLLSSADWTTFNSKQPAGNYLTALTGDVTAAGPGSSASVVNSVGGASAASIATTVSDVAAATNLDTASTIVKRDGSGNFSTSGIDLTFLTFNGATSGSLGIFVPSVVSSYSVTLPGSQGTAGTVLTNDGFGGLTWSNAGSGANVALSNLITTSVNQNLNLIPNPTAQNDGEQIGLLDFYTDVNPNVGTPLQAGIYSTVRYGSGDPSLSSADLRFQVTGFGGGAPFDAGYFDGNGFLNVGGLNLSGTFNMLTASGSPQWKINSDSFSGTGLRIENTNTGDSYFNWYVFSAPPGGATPADVLQFQDAGSQGQLTMLGYSYGAQTGYIGLGFGAFGENPTERLTVDGNILEKGALIQQGSTSGTLSISVPSTVTTYAIQWPNAQGTGLLNNDGGGFLSWQATGDLTTPTSGVSVTGGIGAVIGSGTTISIQTASGSQPGLLSAADWTTFNNKQSALSLGNLTTPTTGVSITGGTGAVVGAGAAISIQTASGSQPGLLSSADWTTFNNKQAAGNYITALTGDATASGPGSAALTLATVATPGTFPKVTFNAKGLVTAGTTLVSGDIPNNAANTSGTASNVTGVVVVANGGTGLSTLTANNVILGNGTSTPNFVAPGTSGNVLTSNGTTWTSSAGSTGTVTSVAISVPSFLMVTGTPVTTSGTFSITLATESPNTFFAGPTTGGAATPTFRAIVAGDVPTLNQNTSGSAASFTGSLVGDVTGTQGATVVSTVGGSSAANVNTATGLANAATSSNVASSIVRRDGSGNFSAGTITASLTGNATNVTGTVAIGNGGTGQTTASTAFNALSPVTTLGDLIYGSGASTNARLAGNTTSAKQFLSQTGTGSVSAAPAWGALVSGDIPNNAANTSGTSSNVTGVVAVANGGTGLSTLTANNVILGNGASAPTFVAPGTTGNVLTSNGTTWSSAAPGFSGTVTSVALALPAIFSVSGSPVTSSGTLTGTLATQTANTIWSGPTSGVAATPTFRTLVGSDIPHFLDSSQIPSTITATTYTVAAADVFIRVDTTSNAITITLPDPTTSRRWIQFKDVTGNLSTNNLTVARFSSEKIDNVAASKVFATNYGSWTFQSDGTNWWLK